MEAKLVVEMQDPLLRDSQRGTTLIIAAIAAAGTAAPSSRTVPTTNSAGLLKCCWNNASA